MVNQSIYTASENVEINVNQYDTLIIMGGDTFNLLYIKSQLNQSLMVINQSSNTVDLICNEETFVIDSLTSIQMTFTALEVIVSLYSGG